MEPIAGIQNAAPGSTRSACRSAPATEGPDRAAPPASLPVALNNPQRQQLSALGRPSAPFLAHLIATAARLPQTRALRREEPCAVAELYARTSNTAAGPTEKVRAQYI